MKFPRIQFKLRTFFVLIGILAVSSPWWTTWYMEYARWHEEYAARSMFTRIDVKRWSRVSPFTKIRVHDDVIDVEYEGAFYELNSVDNIPASRLYRIAELQFGKNDAQRRFVEDFAEVLLATGKDSKSTFVDLVLVDKTDGKTVQIDDATMNLWNRAKLMQYVRSPSYRSNQ